jgi:hypothetical protein
MPSFNNRSYFTNVGYVRTSNFQVEYQDVPSQNTAVWGSQANFIVPKAADLLGPIDLILDIEDPKIDVSLDAVEPNEDMSYAQASGEAKTAAANNATPYGRAYSAWIDELGWACIDRVTFSVANNEVEVLTGDMLQMRNELMTSDELRADYWNTLKTGRPNFVSEHGVRNCERPGTNKSVVTNRATDTHLRKHVNKDYTRINQYMDNTSGKRDGKTGTTPHKLKPYVSEGRTLHIPLNFFFTQHVSQYFPLAAVAGCHDIRIQVTFRNIKELIQHHNFGTPDGLSTGVPAVVKFEPPAIKGTSRLRCHLVHVTGPEAATLMNQEHVRLLKLIQGPTEQILTGNTLKAEGNEFNVRLAFLHPVTELLFVIRRREDMSTDTTDGSVNGCQKGRYFYHGDGTCPNYDIPRIQYTDKILEGSDDTIRIKKVALSLNGAARQPALPEGLENDFIRHRLLPQLHSNTSFADEHSFAMAATDDWELTRDGPTKADAATPAHVGKDVGLSFSQFGTGLAAPLAYWEEVPRVGMKVHIDNRFVGMVERAECWDTNDAQITDTTNAFYTINRVFLDRDFAWEGKLILDHWTTASLTGGKVVNTSTRADGVQYNVTFYQSSKMNTANDHRLEMAMRGTKNIYVYPFCLNPEGSNPSGAVNFSKVSNATFKVSFDYLANNKTDEGSTKQSDFVLSVYGVYYNWLQIKDGRALLSFA